MPLPASHPRAQLLLMTRLFGPDARPDSLAIVALPYRSLVAEKRAALRHLLRGACCGNSISWAAAVCSRVWTLSDILPRVVSAGVAKSSVNSLVPDVERHRRTTRGRVWVTTYEGATRLVDEWAREGPGETRNIRTLRSCGYFIATSAKPHVLAPRSCPGRLACVVADEVHLVGDTDRGYVLEGLLAKVVLHNELVRAEGLPTAQIVAMSATMPNTAEIAGWLRASMFQSAHRPRPLERLVAVKVSVCAHS